MGKSLKFFPTKKSVTVQVLFLFESGLKGLLRGSEGARVRMRIPSKRSLKRASIRILG